MKIPNSVIFRLLFLIHMLLLPLMLFPQNRSDDKISHVLLLNSYHKGYFWTDEITRGIEDTLNLKNVELHIEYMDTKRQFDAIYQNLLSELLSYKHRKFSYDVILTSDNNAYNFIKERGKQIFGPIPHVFTGYNYLKVQDISAIVNTTGINERADLVGNLELIGNIHQDVEKVVLITDNTVTGKQIQEEFLRIRDADLFQDLELELVYDVSFSELTDLVQTQKENTILYVTFFFRDKNEVFLEYDRGMELITGNSSVPVYGSWDFQMGHGIVGGLLVDGYEQGKDAAEKVLQILSGVPVDHIPVKLETSTSFQFDYNILKKYDIPLTALPEQSTIFNLPASFYFQNKRLIWTILIAFLLLFFAFVIVAYGLILSKRAEMKVRSKEQDLRTTLYSIGDAVISTDMNGFIVRMNPVAEDLTGWSKDQAAGKLLSQIFDVENSLTNEPIANPVDIVISSGKRVGLVDHTLLVSKNGSKHHIADSAAPILNDNGEITGVVLVFRDVTEEYRVQQELQMHRDSLKQERDLFENLFETIPLRMYIKDLDSRNIRINQCLADMLRIKDVKDAVGKDNFAYFSKEHAGRAFVDEQEIIKSGRPMIGYEERETWPDGTEGWSLSTKMPFRDHLGQVIGIIGISQDITERKKAEAELFKSNAQLTEYKDHLEELVLERTKELQDSLDDLRKTQDQLVESEKMAALGSIVAGVAHEINTPVGISVTAASHLEEETKQFKKQFLSNSVTKPGLQFFLETNEESLGIVMRNLLRAADLIQSFKLVAVDQSSMEMREFNIKEYTDEILLSLNSKFKHTNFVIDVKCPEMISVNSFPGSYSQIMTNLLMNSLAHGFENRKEGAIHIIISRKEDKVEVLYRDTGQGIPETHLDKIFDPFFTTKRGQGGSGLGLHIVYNLVTQSLKGTIHCHSVFGKGTRFTIEFPINHPDY